MKLNDKIPIYSGITSGRVLNGELYAQRLQKLIDLYVYRDCFIRISLKSSEQSSEKKSVNKYR